MAPSYFTCHWSLFPHLEEVPCCQPPGPVFGGQTCVPWRQRAVCHECHVQRKRERGKGQPQRHLCASANDVPLFSRHRYLPLQRSHEQINGFHPDGSHFPLKRRGSAWRQKCLVRWRWSGGERELAFRRTIFCAEDLAWLAASSPQGCRNERKFSELFALTPYLYKRFLFWLVICFLVHDILDIFFSQFLLKSIFRWCLSSLKKYGFQAFSLNPAPLKRFFFEAILLSVK